MQLLCLRNGKRIPNRRYKEIKDSLFTIVIYNEYGNSPTIDCVSDKDLSLLCNECILNELKVWNV